jgi:hypothetical protein
MAGGALLRCVRHVHQTRVFVLFTPLWVLENLCHNDGC